MSSDFEWIEWVGDQGPYLTHMWGEHRGVRKMWGLVSEDDLGIFGRFFPGDGNEMPETRMKHTFNKADAVAWVEGQAKAELEVR